jgi:hypothetical protein
VDSFAMPDLIRIQVGAYSGYKADEYPLFFHWNDRKYEIKAISDRWYQGDLNPEVPAADYFKVMTVPGDQFILKHEIVSDEWYLVNPPVDS